MLLDFAFSFVVQISVSLDDRIEEVKVSPVQQNQQTIQNEEVRRKDEEKIETGTHSFRLEELAFARSGDKGNHCNIGMK